MTPDQLTLQLEAQGFDGVACPPAPDFELAAAMANTLPGTVLWEGRYLVAGMPTPMPFTLAWFPTSRTGLVYRDATGFWSLADPRSQLVQAVFAYHGWRGAVEGVVLL